jgi:Zn-dependent protease with chaperone function
MLRSLFVRRGGQDDPGRALPREQAPALWDLLADVAGKVGTRAVDAVYLTLGTELAVSEVGSMSQRLRDRGRRRLILGAGVLDGLTRQQLRAILAHEYGHFSNRDTAGGGAALVVQASVFYSAVRIARAGGATWYNPAWHFVRAFHALFLRITLGASRLQEIMADHFAAVAYGAPAFAQGLEHVVRRSLEFERNAQSLARRAQREGRAIPSLYAAPEEMPEGRVELERAIAARMNDTASPYDSHPPPGQRLEWAAKVPAPSEPPAADADLPAWSLFPERVAIEEEMTARANANLRAQGVRLVD